MDARQRTLKAEITGSNPVCAISIVKGQHMLLPFALPAAVRRAGADRLIQEGQRFRYPHRREIPVFSVMRPYAVRFHDPLPSPDLRVTPGRSYDVLSVQLGIKPNGERDVWLVIEDDDGAAEMVPARLCEILDISQLD